MSGIVGSKLNIRGSGRIAKLGTDGQVLTSSGPGVQANYEDAAGGGLDWQSVETGSTMTAVAGNGYPINTTSNTCTITLPSSASVGDTIVFADYARTWGTNGIIIDSNGLNYQGDDDTYTVAYGTDGIGLRIVYMDATQGWIPLFDAAVSDVPEAEGNQEGLFGFGANGSYYSITNIVANTGVVGSDVSGVGTGRKYLAACEYGGDKGIFAFGRIGGGVNLDESNLVSNTGVVSTDVTGVGTDRSDLSACEYGEDKGIMGYGAHPSYFSLTNLVSNAGVVATDTTGVGTARGGLGSCEYGTDTAIFGYGTTGSEVSMTNLVANTGVVATDVTGVGTARSGLQACSYGGDKGIFAYGVISGVVSSLSNLVSNAGVVATDVTGVGTAREYPSACEYAGDKGIFGFGAAGAVTAVTNLVSNAGVVATDVAGVGTVRKGGAGCSFN